MEHYFGCIIDTKDLRRLKYRTRKMAEFSIPIRKYSYYTTLEAAPSGFDSGKTPTLVDKWNHVSSDGRINLMFSNTSPNKLLMRVVTQPYLQDLEVIDFFALKSTFAGFNHEPFQFSAKAPSISCKYLIKKDDNTIVMKRFQLGFHNGVDFVQATDILQKLGFVVKPAVTTRSNTVLSPSQSFFFNPNQTAAFPPEQQICSANYQFYNQPQVKNPHWQNSQQSFLQTATNMDFVLSQSTPLPAPRVPLFNEQMQNLVTQQTPEPSIEKEQEQNNDITKEKNYKGELKLENPTSKLTLEVPTVCQIKSKLADPEFMKWVCY